MGENDPGAATNRLAAASSPYLLLHRHNPVDWYPWGEEALERARREDRPIFLSVGYSTCYWCHVMERESFSSPDVAAAMNASFVNVKLDREERPDLDEVYMVATQLMTGQGGWPNSVFLTPQLEPFFAGTYFPPEDRWGRPGFKSILAGVADAWRERRADVEAQARELAGAVGHYLQHRLAPAAAPPGPEVASASLRALAERFDPVWGGFGQAPKFPTPSNLLLLLEHAGAGAESGEREEARRMLAVTLDRMLRGGLYDQLAGGFHRYATDREWRVPHFEKMLYDNGALLEVYARAHELLGDPELERVARETAAFLEREMSGPEGGFWSAIDAETGGREGAYHVWRAEEIESVLGREDAEFLAPFYGFAGPPFFEGDHYVLHLPRALADQAERRRVGREELLASIAPLRARLLAARDRRPRPLTDDKVLADWNGLAIAGLAAAGRVFGEARWVARAASAADFVLGTLRAAPGSAGGRGTLLHAWRAGRGEVPAFLADYAYLAHGLLALHEATGEARWLAAAEDLTVEQRRRLAHEEGGFYTAEARPDLLFRSREVFDGASPSPNGVAVLNLLALAERTGHAEHREEARRALCAFAPLVAAQPAAARTLCVAVMRFHGGAGEAGGERATGPARPVATPPAGTEPTSLRPHGASAGPAEEAAAVVRVELETALPAPADVSTDAVWRPFRLRLRIAPGWHLAAPGGLPGATPLAVEGVGCELRAVDLPEPRPVALGDGTTQLAHAGEIDVPGELRPSGPDRPRLRLRYQACDDRRCLLPIAREIDVRG